jgi:hypothetical protein
VEAENGVLKKVKECQKDMEEKLLGILSMHAQIFGRKAFRELMGRANDQVKVRL